MSPEQIIVVRVALITGGVLLAIPLYHDGFSAPRGEGDAQIVGAIVATLLVAIGIVGWTA